LLAFLLSGGLMDDFYAAKFQEDGSVRPGWDYKAWTLWRMSGCEPTGTRNAHHC
jgi:hypothetical protein